ncbi:MAG TPA: recombination mediator RecR [Xanthomonadales bacterium]|nr:recombination mediator RecR [Xanthomonadales bacterium]
MGEERLLEQLIEALRCLPGVGPKSAQRMAFHVLERDRDGARHLSTVLKKSCDEIGHCDLCRNLTEGTRCHICDNPSRSSSLLCVVESPSDVIAIERATGFRGSYFVLLGKLSPIDGIGPSELGLDLLKERLETGEVTELIIATNPTVEGEATAYYLQELAGKYSINVSRIAHGVPLGGELEYIDQSTLAMAFSTRKPLSK